MEFAFSEDQDELRRAARRFLEVASSEERVRAAMETEQGYDSATWEQLSEELAWTALTIPEEYGGLGMSYLDLHPLMEEMGRALLCSPFFSTICLGANALLLGGNGVQKERHLPGSPPARPRRPWPTPRRTVRWTPQVSRRPTPEPQPATSCVARRATSSMDTRPISSSSPRARKTARAPRV